MNNATAAPESATPTKTAIRLATAFGLGYAPVAPGTAGSLVGVGIFALLLFTLEGVALDLAFIAVSLCLVATALWSTERALPHWTSQDPSAVVIDEVLGQFLTYGGPLAVAYAGVTTVAPTWKTLLAGLILFRAFDVLKPYPIRQSEGVPGAAGVVLDDFLAAVYAALVLGVLSWVGWLR